MKTLVLSAVAILFFGFSPSNPELVNELRLINQKYKRYEKYQVNITMSVVDQSGKTLTNQEMTTARENGYYYTEGNNVQLFAGENGTFMINTPSKRVFYDPLKSYNDTNTYIDNALKSIKLASRSVLIKGKESNTIEFFFDDPIDGLKKIEMVYNNSSKLIEMIRLYSDNVGPDQFNPIKGFVSIRYGYSPLTISIGKKYNYLLKQVLSQDKMLSGDFDGYTFMN